MARLGIASCQAFVSKRLYSPLAAPTERFNQVLVFAPLCQCGTAIALRPHSDPRQRPFTFRR
jgi:hypothetical protein